MWTAPALAIAIGVLVVAAAARRAARGRRRSWSRGCSRRVVAFRVSQPGAVATSPLTDAERRALRRVARKTWLFFETFVGDADHWLPPDNFQEVPDGRIAHRTSPTNMGLLLLSTAGRQRPGLHRPAAGWSSGSRRRSTRSTGWRSTGATSTTGTRRETLQPLPPRYISTVDSGNLLGCLMALAHGLREKAEAPLLGPAVIEGLADTFGLAAEPAGPQEPGRRLAALLESPPADLRGWDTWLGRFERGAPTWPVSPDQRPRSARNDGPSRLVEQAVPGGPAASVARRAGNVCSWIGAVRACRWLGRKTFGRRSRLVELRATRGALAPASLSAIVEPADRLAAELAALAAEAADPDDSETPAAIAAARARSAAGRATGPAPPPGRRGRATGRRHGLPPARIGPIATSSPSASTWCTAGSTAPATT